MKQEFEMTQEEMDDIIQINKDQMPVLVICGITTGMDLAEKINWYWRGLGEKYGFHSQTAEGSSKGKLFFLASPKPIVIPKTKEELAMDEFDTIPKIVEALEAGKYESIAGPLENLTAFRALKRMTDKKD